MYVADSSRPGTAVAFPPLPRARDEQLGQQDSGRSSRGSRSSRGGSPHLPHLPAPAVVQGPEDQTSKDLDYNKEKPESAASTARSTAAVFLTAIPDQPAVQAVDDAQQQPEEQKVYTLANLHSKLCREVKRDIRRTLGANRAYQRHARGPLVMTAGTLNRLAEPRYLVHPDIAVGAHDPVQYAQWKANQLMSSRTSHERVQSILEKDNQVRKEQLSQYQIAKAVKKEDEAKAKKEAQTQEAAYRQALATYVKTKAQSDLAAYQVKKAKERERAVAVHQEHVTGFFAA